MHALPHSAPRRRRTASETLHDRSEVLIRPATAGETAAPLANGCAADTVPLRFAFECSASPCPGEAHRGAAEVALADDAPPTGWIAESPAEGGRIVAHGLLRASRDGTHCACELGVAGDWHARGLAPVIARHVLQLAREQGMRRIRASAPSTDVAMADLAMALGFRTRVDPRDPARVLHERQL